MKRTKMTMYFKIGDFLIPSLMGGISGLFTFWLVNPEWNMFIGMGTGMVCGMVLQILVIVLLMPLFGAFEVMIPAMISGMVSGMIVGMFSAMYVLSPGMTFIFGCGIGALVWLWIGIKNRQLKGIVQ